MALVALPPALCGRVGQVEACVLVWAMEASPESAIKESVCELPLNLPSCTGGGIFDVVLDVVYDGVNQPRTLVNQSPPGAPRMAGL